MLARKLMSAMGGAAPDPELVSSSIQFGNTSTITVTAPSGIQDGDVLVAVAFHRATGNTVTAVPIGFIRQFADTASNNSEYVWTKVANSESGNYTFTISTSGGGTASIGILVFRNASPQLWFGSITKANSNTSTGATFSPTIDGILVGAFGTEANTPTISTPPSGMTLRQSDLNATASLALYTKDPSVAGATGALTLVWSTSSQNFGLLFQVLPAKAVSAAPFASATGAGVGGALTINKPTGVQSGDLLIAVMAGGTGGAGGTWTGDTGWSEVADQGGGSTADLRVAYKVAGASEPSSYSFTYSGGITTGGTIAAFRGYSYGTIGSFTTATDPLVIPSVTTSSAYPVLLAFAGTREEPSITMVLPTTFTNITLDNDATTPSYVFGARLASTGISSTTSVTAGTTNGTGAVQFVIYAE